MNRRRLLRWMSNFAGCPDPVLSPNGSTVRASALIVEPAVVVISYASRVNQRLRLHFQVSVFNQWGGCDSVCCFPMVSGEHFGAECACRWHP